ncbi:MAG: hypothetical protein OHK0017_06630 [Patescibacteria group bacterium]
MSDGGGCELPITTTYKGKTSSLILRDLKTAPVINSESASKSDFDKVLFENFTSLNENNFTAAVSLFRNSCSGAGYVPVTEMTLINYPKTEQSRVYLANVGQDAPGNLSILIFAKKDDQLIMIQYVMTEETKQLQDYFEFCADEKKQTSSDANEVVNCLINQVKSDKSILDAADTQAKRLINDYGLI